MNRTKKTIIIVSSILVVLLIVAAIFGGKRKNVTVETEMVSKRSIVETVSASGKIQPEIEVKISAEVSGLIFELPVKEGDLVNKSDLLVGINPDIYESALNRAEAAVNTARASLSSAKARKLQAEAQFMAAERAFERSKELHEKGAISQADYDQALSSFEVSQAEVEAASQSIKSAEFSVASALASKREAGDNLNRTTLRAPMAGTVTALTKEVGEAVLGTSMMQGETIMKVSDLSSMEVNVEVNESDIVRVSLGDTANVEVDAYLDETFKGVVTEISNTALNSLDNNMLNMNQVTNFSVKVRILRESYAHLMNDTEAHLSPFRPGMSATVEIQTARADNVVAVPIKAVTTRQDTASNSFSKYTKKEKTEELDEDIVCVFVLENGKSVLKPIETGVQDNKYIEIVKGLSGDEEIIVGPYDQVANKLKNGKGVDVSSGNEEEEEEE